MTGGRHLISYRKTANRFKSVFVRARVLVCGVLCVCYVKETRERGIGEERHIPHMYILPIVYLQIPVEQSARLSAALRRHFDTNNREKTRARAQAVH